MAWVKLQYDNKEAREFIDKVGRKTKFYADEDVDDSIIYVLRYRGFDVESAKERGLTGHSDEFHFKRAAKFKRVLITHDHDYLDHEQFPLSQTSGVCIIHVDRSDTRQLSAALHVVQVILGSWGLLWRQAKIVIKSDYTLRMYERPTNGDPDEVLESRWKFDTNGVDIWYWEENAE